jgi:uncharacterized membrane protein
MRGGSRRTDRVDFWVAVFLFMHVMGAIVAFGPSFVFPLIGAASARDPQHAHFGAVVSEIIEKRLVLPFAVLQGVTGLALILVLKLDLFATHWLLLGIALYLIAIVFAVVVQARNVARMVELTSVPPPSGAAPGGPPPEIVATGKQLQRGGMLLSVLIVAIVILMVTKPSF